MSAKDNQPALAETGAGAAGAAAAETDAAEARRRILAYLESHHVLVLCTADADGPWSTPLFYAARGHKLVFLSNPETRHCQHLAANPRVAATVTEPYSDWRQIQGVQLEGEVRPLTGVLARTAALAVYLARFPVLAGSVSAGGALVGAFAKARCYELTVGRAWMTDNPSGFGTRWHHDCFGEA